MGYMFFSLMMPNRRSKIKHKRWVWEFGKKEITIEAKANSKKIIDGCLSFSASKI
ncbi:MAG: hypothetical protein CM15mP23_15890 [Cryomorphaceae bacterium]|nr:MAG: hypothetical protein CM15mP23_15890 [Cryomorphaceae bacterium]